MARAFWLLKSEPEVYPFSQLVTERTTLWEGVRNHQARNNLAAMAISDLVLFYHSHDAEVVGIARVCQAARPDPTSDDPRWIAVEIEAVKPFTRPVSLAEIRADRGLAKLALVTQPRLSVMPLSKPQFDRLLAIGRTALPRGLALRSARAAAADGPG